MSNELDLQCLTKKHALAMDRVDSMAHIDLFDETAYARREGLRHAMSVLDDVIKGRYGDGPMLQQALACLATHGL